MSLFSQFGGLFGKKGLPATTSVNPMSVADAVVSPAEPGAIYAAPAPGMVEGLSTGMPAADFSTTMQKLGGLLGDADAALNGAQWQSDAPPPPSVSFQPLQAAAPIANAPRRADLFRLGGQALPRHATF